jgi:8-oxo-dGTP diphosphatase
MARSPRVRVAAVIVHENKLLVVKHEKNGVGYYLLPGGGLDWSESIFQCAKRELLEETGYFIEPEEVIFTSEAVAPGGVRHIVNFFVRSRFLGGELTPPEDDIIVSVDWITKEELKTLSLFPAMNEELLAAWEHDFKVPPRHLDIAWK